MISIATCKQRVAAIPGVEHVSTGFSVPWRDSMGLNISLAFAMDGAARQNAKDDLRAKFRSISPGFFNTLGVPLLEGRDFRDTDKDGSERVVIISQSVANKLFPGQDPLNREMRWTDPVIKFIGISAEPRRIVGVVPDIDDENIIPEPGITIYQPVRPGRLGKPPLRPHQGRSLRARADHHPHHPRHVRRPTRRARQHPRRHSRRGPHPRPPQRHRLRRIRRRRALHLRRRSRRRSRLLRQRPHPRIRHPHGPRRAAAHHPHRRPLRWPLIAGIGVGAGIVVGLAFARVIGKYVAEVQLPGVLVFIASAVVILAAAVIASAVPAARAAKVNPVEALRSE